MTKFTYIDHSDYPDDKVLFVCVADTILEADVKLEEATGKDPVKCSYIGCRIEKLEE